MSKLFKNAVFILCLTFSFFLLTAVSGFESVKEKLDKHRVSSSDKYQIEDALKGNNYEEAVSYLYPSKSKVTFSEPVKLYTLEDDNILKNYKKSLNLVRFITKDYNIVQSIRDENNDTIGTVLFRKGKGLIEVQDTINNTNNQEVKDDLIKFAKENEDKWYVSSIGGGLPNKAALLFTDFKVIKQKLHELGVDKVNDLFLLASSEYLPMMVYIRIRKEEYVFPIAIYGEINYETGNLYKLEDLINYEIRRIDKSGITAVPSAGTPRSSQALQPVTHIKAGGIFSVQSFTQLFIVLVIYSLILLGFNYILRRQAYEGFRR